MISNNKHILNGFKAQPIKPRAEVRKTAAQSEAKQSAPVDRVTSLKTPRPGSSMAQMVEDLQNNGVIPKAQTEETPPKPPVKAREGSDMAQMVEQLNRSELQSLHTVSVGANGTLTILEEHLLPPQSHTSHGHENQRGDALLQGHLGTEVVEQVAHKASHGAHHVAEAVGHKSQSVTSHVADNVAQKSSHLADSLTESTADIAEAGHHGAVEHLDSVSETAAHGAGQLSSGLQLALGASSMLSFGLAVPLAKNATKELKHGWKDLKAGIEKKGLRGAVKDGDGVLPLAEGVGGGAVAVRSAAASTVMANMTGVGHAIPGMSGVASVASKVLMPLGLIHAGVDIAVGAHEFKNGKKTEGLLKMGFGVAVGGAAVTGALPFTVAAISLLGGKIAHGVAKSRKAKIAAAP